MMIQDNGSGVVDERIDVNIHIQAKGHKSFKAVHPGHFQLRNFSN